MNKERYFELKKLEENKDLSDDEFYNKYKDEFEDKVVYRENKIINNVFDFKNRMQNIKDNFEKKVIRL